MISIYLKISKLKLTPCYNNITQINSTTPYSSLSEWQSHIITIFYQILELEQRIENISNSKIYVTYDMLENVIHKPKLIIKPMQAEIGISL